MRPRLILATLTLALTASLQAQQPSPAVVADPAPDAAHPPSMDAFQLPSHGQKLNALAYLTAGPGTHPTVILLHGFPGNERNLDLAQAIRRDGWNVLFFDYRGSWGTPGTFSFTHSMEDTQAAIAYLREPTNAARLHVDPANIVLIGHSMGGMIAANIGAHDPTIRAIGLISAANMAGRFLPVTNSSNTPANIKKWAARLDQEGIYPLAGCTSESLARELLANAARWNFPDFAPLLNPRPILILTSDDGLAPDNDRLAANLRALNDPHFTALHLTTDHTYSGQRIALESAVIDWLNHLPSSPNRPSTQSFDATQQQSNLALEAILNGNPKLYEDLFADRDDITLGNPSVPTPSARLRSTQPSPTPPPNITMAKSSLSTSSQNTATNTSSPLSR
jgi:pimeloyl-ACP methyl ester carboxylesterase